MPELPNLASQHCDTYCRKVWRIGLKCQSHSPDISFLQRGKRGYLSSDELVFQDGAIIICSKTWGKDSLFLSLKLTLQIMLAGNLFSKSLRKAKKNTKTFRMTSKSSSMYVYMCRKQPCW